MTTHKSTAIAHPNIAFIKYWGNADHQLRIPLHNSFSMNLKGLETKTTVEFEENLQEDQLILNGKALLGAPLKRVSRFFDRVRKMAEIGFSAKVVSENNFPTGSGIASSASGFAALALAASHAAGLSLDEADLSRLARTGSGSASRSVPAGFVEWEAGTDHQSSYAFSIADADHWELHDLIAVVSQEHKATGSTGGHAIAHTSPLQNARIAHASDRINICRKALLERDFETFADIVQLDSNMMHAVMMTSQPNLFYWEPVSIDIMKLVQNLREDGLKACYTLDAGPNVHILCDPKSVAQIKEALSKLPGIQTIYQSQPGEAARIIPNN